MGWDVFAWIATITMGYFNPPTPHGVGPLYPYAPLAFFDISIHPPRMGWDSHVRVHQSAAPQFQSTHPAWGGTAYVLLLAIHKRYFNPPTPHGVGPACPVKSEGAGRISIHPPRMGWDVRLRKADWKELNISIHPPRMGWDSGIDDLGQSFDISIHPPRMGWDNDFYANGKHVENFNPPTPHGVGLIVY